MKKAIVLAAGFFCGIASVAQAHVGLSPAEIPAGGTALISLGVGHGCGESPTTAIRVQIPAGIISVQPVPKPGWNIDIVTGAYAEPQMNGDAQVTEGVTELTWTGGTLPGTFYDQFVFRAKVASNAEHGSTIWFPVIQECAEGVHRWITVPVEGQPEPEEPTPGLVVGEPAEAAHMH